MQVVQFANSLVDARNELQHKYVQTYLALDISVYLLQLC